MTESASSIPDVAPGTRRYFFVHLQKTAGTSLIWMLRKQWGRAAVYPDDSDGPRADVARVISVAHLQERLRARGDEIRLITGHYPLCVRDLVGDPYTFTVLRDPVERTLSYLRHHIETVPKDAQLSLEELYDDPFYFHSMIHNYMVKMFSLTPDEMNDGLITQVEFTDERLTRAKDQLQTVDVVGLQDDLGAFARNLDTTFGWDLGAERRLNRSQAAPVPESFRRRIIEDNAADLEFYDFARDLVARS